ncbi:MAG TPA: phosphotransferase [Acidimicrobiales bacterium]|nr:phosphotransferase [Acidimicrobiales bacterium]
MQTTETERATTAVRSIAAGLGLAADDAVVLHNSNKLTLRLRPAEVLARVAREGQHEFGLEIDLAGRLTAAGAPVAALDPRVAPRPYARDGFVVTLWTYYPPVTAGQPSPADYADALARLHAGLRHLDVPSPHFTDRVEHAQQLVADPDRTPELPGDQRALLADTLDRRRRAVTGRGPAEQLLHGEPHPGNLLGTDDGLRFVDLETCCRGPVEFDLAYPPEEVADHYPGVDRELLRDCRTLMLAMITAWRWDRDDQLPGGHQLAGEWTAQLRAALDGRV